MARKWKDFDDAIHIAEALTSQERNQVNPPQDAVAAENLALIECMDSVIVELRFLFTFFGYTHIWSDASESQNHNDTTAATDLDSLVTKVAAAAKAFRKDLHTAFVDNYSDYYFTEMELELTTQLAAIWRKTRHCFPYCGSKPSKLLHVFACLKEQVGYLKPQIGEALKSVSSDSFQPKPLFPYSNQTSAWQKFCNSVELNMQFLLESSDFPGPLGDQMEALKQSLISFKGLLRDTWISGSIRTNVMAHFGEVMVRLAHVCCLCWYAPLDQPRAKNIAVLLSDLQHKIDLASPAFLDMILEFIGLYHLEFMGLYYGRHYTEGIRKWYVAFFVHAMLGVREETVLHEELVFLVTFLLKMPEVYSLDVNSFSVDIKDALMEASYLKNKDHRTYIIDFVGLFAKIWFIKADIFVKSKSTLLPLSLKDQTIAIYEGSRFLTNSFGPPVEKTEHQVFKLIEEVPRLVESLYKSSHAGASVGNKVRDVLYKFHVKIILFQAKALLLELLNKNAGSILPLKPQIGILHEGLIFMIESDIINQEKNTEEDKLILEHMEAVAIRARSLCTSFSAEEVTEEAVRCIEPRLSNLLEMVRRLKAKLKELYLHIPRLNFPKIPTLCFFEFFLRNLKQLLSDVHDSVAYPTHHIETICWDMEFIVSILGNVVTQGIENQEYKDLHERLVGLVHEAEYVIDSIVVGNDAIGQLLLWLHHLSEEIRHIKMQLAYSHGNNTYDDGVHAIPQRLIPFVSLVSMPRTEEVMVGLHDQKEAIIERLTRGTSQRDILSIVGMPGIGKTTLANNVFCSPRIIYHFHIRAWCCVSQTYRKRDLILDILSHIVRLTDDILAMNVEDLDLMLYQGLKGKRYLIVMDDLWSTEALDDLRSSFPDDSNGSRILITSRLHDVVSSNTHILHELSDDESWELLKAKIFHEEQCPEELLEVGEKIAKSCKGLPLAIGAVAGLLDRLNKNQDSWNEIAESVCSTIVNDPQTRCKDILELSYDHLPDHLKACFLYFGAFSEDKDIPVQKLLWLWIAEGFIHKVESKSLEDLAEDYLMDLVGRSLVIVSKRRSNGKVKACRVHDLVRDLCLLKAKADTFLKLISSNDEPYSSWNALDYDVHYMLFNASKSITYKEHRLCFYVNRGHFVASRPSGPYVRSLLFFATNDMYPRCPYDLSFISSNFKLLRVLDLEWINMGNSFGNGIPFLVHLRYLAVSGDIDFIPSSLSNLQNLETLIVKGLKSMVVLPNTLWSMRNLRHIHVTNHAMFALQNEKDGQYSLLDSLITLSMPSLSYGEETNNIIARFPNLRKLRCIFLDVQDVSTHVCVFPRLESLWQLESLKISHYGRDFNTGELKLPSSLTKLTLSNFRLPWNHISAIGKLQNLEVLKLISQAFEGSSWDMKEGEFLKLKYLKLDTLNVVHWDATNDHLPQLQQLVLRNCKQLKKVPFGFVGISTLQKIEVLQCGVSAEESVRRIEEEEIEGLEIVINNSHSA